MTRPAVLRPFVALLIEHALVVARVGSPSAAVENLRILAFGTTKAVLTAPECASKQASAPCAGTGNALRLAQASEPPRGSARTWGGCPNLADRFVSQEQASRLPRERGSAKKQLPPMNTHLFFVNSSALLADLGRIEHIAMAKNNSKLAM